MRFATDKHASLLFHSPFIPVKSRFFSRLPLALGAGCCMLALASCTPQPATDDNAAPAVTSENTVAPTSDDNAADANATNSAVEFASLETIYLPGKDDLLHPEKVSRMAIDSQLKSGDRAAPGLQEIIEKAPEFFPKNAKINSTTQTEKGMTVDLNQAFANDEFWRGKGEKVTELAVYALVNSAAKVTGAQGVTEPKPVTFTIEKKPAATMGEFDVEGEIKPQDRLVAPK